MSLQIALLTLPIWLLALCVHEFAHAWTAVRLGDPTPRWQGRLTLNPRVHLSLLGTLMIFLVGLGWANPVQVNTRNLNNPKVDMAWIALAGPLANILMAIAFAGLYHIIVPYLPFTRTGIYGELFLRLGVYINAALFVLNMLPIPPLDGSKLLALIAPSHWYRFLMVLEQYGVLILFFLLAMLNFGRTIGAGATAIVRLLGVG